MSTLSCEVLTNIFQFIGTQGPKPKPIRDVGKENEAGHRKLFVGLTPYPMNLVCHKWAFALESYFNGNFWNEKLPSWMKSVVWLVKRQEETTRNSWTALQQHKCAEIAVLYGRSLMPQSGDPFSLVLSPDTPEIQAKERKIFINFRKNSALLPSGAFAYSQMKRSFQEKSVADISNLEIQDLTAIYGKVTELSIEDVESLKLPPEARLCRNVQTITFSAIAPEEVDFRSWMRRFPKLKLVRFPNTDFLTYECHKSAQTLFNKVGQSIDIECGRTWIWKYSMTIEGNLTRTYFYREPKRTLLQKVARVAYRCLCMVPWLVGLISFGMVVLLPIIAVRLVCRILGLVLRILACLVSTILEMLARPKLYLFFVALIYTVIQLS